MLNLTKHAGVYDTALSEAMARAVANAKFHATLQNKHSADVKVHLAAPTTEQLQAQVDYYQSIGFLVVSK